MEARVYPPAFRDPLDPRKAAQIPALPTRWGVPESRSLRGGARGLGMRVDINSCALWRQSTVDVDQVANARLADGAGGGSEVLSPVALSAAGRSTASTIQTRVSHAPQPMLAFQRRSEDAAASPPTVVSRTLDVAHQARSPPWAMACDGSTLRSSGDHSRAAPRPRCLLEAHISTLEDRAGPCRPICALSFAAR